MQSLSSINVIPSVENYPFPPSELVLETVVIDLCAHACTVKVSEDGQRYDTVYDVSALPLGQGCTKDIRIPVPTTPAFVRLTIGGYARVGISGLRCETPLKDFTAGHLYEVGGEVIDPRHILVQDRQSTIFNTPDVETKWRGGAPLTENYVVIGF